MTAATIIWLVGICVALVTGGMFIGYWIKGYLEQFPNPPATRRQIRRSRKSSRADLGVLLKQRPPGPTPRSLDHFDFNEGDTRR